MRSVRNRLSRLEKKIGSQQGLMVVIQAGPSDDEISALLSEREIDPDHPDHLITVFRTMYENKDGGLSADQPHAKILSITEQK